MLDAVLEQMAVSCCIDVGHLWKQGLDPLLCLDTWLARCRVVHMHGVDRRDHKSLSLMPAEILDPVIERLVNEFAGVLTLEVFSEHDLEQSLAALQGSMRRVSNRSNSTI
jgi:sugar phosphate isomerase/epimerase